MTVFLAFAVGLLVFLAASGRAHADGYKCNVPIRAITKGPKAHWFSYYDKHQFDRSGRYALGMEVDFEDRTPEPDDVITLGVIDLEGGDEWKPFAETRAWCWQQGCMLQWLPGSDSEVIFNDRDGDHYVSVICDPFTGERRTLSRPVYTVSPDGTYAMSVSFERIDDTRPGYGYKGVADPNSDVLAPKDDGLYRLDLESGESERVFTLAEIAAIPRETPQDGKHWFNHLLINPDGSRFEFLHRAYREPVKEGGWITRMFTAKPDGTDLHCVNDTGHVSHFIWRDPQHIIAWSLEPEEADDENEGRHFHLYRDKTEQYETIGAGVLNEDGHITYSPDGQWVLTDTYPDDNRMQKLMLYRPGDGKLVMLGEFYSPKTAAGEIRCDLHPRWDRAGTHVCIDSMCEGNRRQMYLLDVQKAVGS